MILSNAGAYFSQALTGVSEGLPAVGTGCGIFLAQELKLFNDYVNANYIKKALPKSVDFLDMKVETFIATQELMDST